MRKREVPRHIIMHVGTNYFNSENNPGRAAAESIVDLTEGMVSEKRKIAVSGIIPKNDE